jgi:hypothetical protein
MELVPKKRIKSASPFTLKRDGKIFIYFLKIAN